jgi:hypothetical protein
MADLWTLTVDIPDSKLVPVRRKRSSGFEQMSIGIPALHNVHSRTRRHAVKKVQQAALAGGLLARGTRDLELITDRLPAGERFDVLIIRRAPRPLDWGIAHGEWKDGGRLLYGDNASSSTKPTRDWTAKRVFGLDDDSHPGIRWHVGQERSGQPKLYQLSVLIAPAEDCECRHRDASRRQALAVAKLLDLRGPGVCESIQAAIQLEAPREPCGCGLPTLPGRWLRGVL